jgi:hypothetical protein
MAAEAPEFWVMLERKRVGRMEDLDTAEQAAVASGALALIVMGHELALCEPIECCDSQETATGKALGHAARTGRTYTVVLNADLDNLAVA